MRKQLKKRGNIYSIFRGAMIRCGRSVAATKTFLGVLSDLKAITKMEDPKVLFDQTIQKIKPIISVRSYRVAGSVVKIPYRVSPGLEERVAVRWFDENARKRPGHGIYRHVRNEFVDAYNNRGSTFKRKQDVYNQVFANQPQLRFIKERFIGGGKEELDDFNEYDDSEASLTGERKKGKFIKSFSEQPSKPIRSKKERTEIKQRVKFAMLDNPYKLRYKLKRLSQKYYYFRKDRIKNKNRDKNYNKKNWRL